MPRAYKVWPCGVPHVDAFNAQFIGLYVCFPDPIGYFAVVDDVGNLVEIPVTWGGAVKHPDGTRTPELPGIEPAKRGRGRPPKHDALTPAERAARYRYRKAPTYAAAFKAGHWPFPTTSRELCP